VDDHSYIGALSAAIIYLVVGARLLRLASRTGELPERLLGLLFVFSGISWALYEVPILLDSDALWTPLNFAGRAAYIPAAVVLAEFTRRVFRPDSAWAAWLVCGCAAMLVVAVGGSALQGDWEGFSISNPLFWLEWVGYTFPFGWAGIEALIQYRQAKKRMRLGLSTALVSNRLLLWGVFGTTSALLSMIYPFQYAAYERHGVFTSTWDAVAGLGEVWGIALIWLVFFPPAPYRRWVDAAASRGRAAEEG
jgi:hypothetical protein